MGKECIQPLLCNHYKAVSQIDIYFLLFLPIPVLIFYTFHPQEVNHMLTHVYLEIVGTVDPLGLWYIYPLSFLI